MPPGVGLGTLRDKFRGCLLGGAVGDMAGAPVEAESPGYIAGTYESVDEILSTDSVPEFTGPDWRVGRFTDDTEMTVCVAEWLLAGESPSAEYLLARFADAYEPWRRYGSGTEAILRMFPPHRAQWRELSTAMFPQGSYGNGSAMRVAPVGLAYFGDADAAASVAIESSRPTHSHSLAYQGAVIQTLAVAAATASGEALPAAFLQPLRSGLARFSHLMQDTSRFARALDSIEQGLARGASCGEMSSRLGTGLDARGGPDGALPFPAPPPQLRRGHPPSRFHRWRHGHDRLHGRCPFRGPSRTAGHSRALAPRGDATRDTARP